MSSLTTRAWLSLEKTIEAERDFRRRTYPPDVRPTFLPNYEIVVNMARQRYAKVAAQETRA